LWGLRIFLGGAIVFSSAENVQVQPFAER